MAKGDVHIQLTKHAGQSDFRYEYFYLDVPGHPRIYLENAAAAKPTPKKKEFKLFGVKWN